VWDTVNTLDRAAAQLVEESAVDMVSELGGEVEVWTISSSGPCVRASAPRLRVTADSTLTCRVSIDGAPHVVTVLLEQAEIQSASRAALQLRVVDAVPDGAQRAADRVAIAGRATLSAVACSKIPPGEPLIGHLVDVSCTGIGALVADPRLQPNDRLELHSRMLEGEIRCHVRVKHVQATGRAGERRIGCMLIDPAPAVQATLDRLLGRLTGPADPSATSAIRVARSLAEPPAEPPPPRRRSPIAFPPLARPSQA
jgi:hypothetical protein